MSHPVTTDGALRRRKVAFRSDGWHLLGLVAWYEIDRGFGLGTIRAGLQSLAAHRYRGTELARLRPGHALARWVGRLDRHIERQLGHG
jgi:hypothetical protein